MMSHRIAMVTPYYEPIFGGITSFVRGLASGLRALGADVTIITKEGKPQPGVISIKGSKGSFVRATQKVLERISPEVIHSHAHWYTLKPALFHQADSDSASTVVFSFHSQWSRRGPIRLRLLAHMLSRCNLITFPSRYLRAITPAEFQRGNVQVIPPGTDPIIADSNEITDFREKYTNPSWVATIGYVGKFEWPDKVRGFGLFLEALASPSLADIGALVAGGGKLLDRMRKEARRLGLDDRVRFLGDFDRPSVLYLACDLYCHPSLQEGMSMSVLEAMRAGKAVIGFRTPFMAEAIQDGVHGILVPPDSAAFAEALSGLLVDRDRMTTLGKAAQQRASGEFDWGNVSRQFLSGYRMHT